MKMKSLAETQFNDPRILASAYDAQNYKFSAEYCNFYIELICADRRKLDSVSKFYICSLIKEMNTILSFKEREKLEKFFGLKGGPKHYLKVVTEKDVALQQMIFDAALAADKLDCFDSLYNWHEDSRISMDRIAAKVYDPDKRYSNVEKAKLAHCYYRYIHSMLLMAYDYKKNGNLLLSQEEQEVEDRVFAVPDLLLEEWDCFFKNLPDGDIIPEMVKYFLEIIPKECKEFIAKDCQISEKKYHRITLGSVRKIKEQIFYTGNWFNGTFCTFSEIKKIKLKNFLDLISVANASNDQWIGKHFRKRTVLFPAQGSKSVLIQEFIGKRTFASEFECKMFKESIEFLENTDFVFHKKLFREYEFSKLLK